MADPRWGRSTGSDSLGAFTPSLVRAVQGVRRRGRVDPNVASLTSFATHSAGSWTLTRSSTTRSLHRHSSRLPLQGGRARRTNRPAPNRTRPSAGRGASPRPRWRQRSPNLDGDRAVAGLAGSWVPRSPQANFAITSSPKRAIPSHRSSRVAPESPYNVQGRVWTWVTPTSASR